jgi:hypothetical protein
MDSIITENVRSKVEKIENQFKTIAEEITSNLKLFDVLISTKRISN